MSVKTATGAHRSARERREAVLEAAVAEFAVGGLHGASTEAIAARAGISQPYVFRLYGTKKDLFIAAVERGFDRVAEAFRRAATTGEGDVLQRMGNAYFRLLERREELLMQLQTYAACADPDVMAVAQRRYGELVHYVQHVSGADGAAIHTFFAEGMLCTVAAAIGLPMPEKDGHAAGCP